MAWAAQDEAKNQNAELRPCMKGMTLADVQDWFRAMQEWFLRAIKHRSQDVTYWARRRLEALALESVTLSKEEGRKVLAATPLRRNSDGYPLVRYQKDWCLLCRTDLKDDVCTSYSTEDKQHDLETLRAEYLERISLGVRVRKSRGGDHMLFACIDAYSDG
jgi:hypothetical protein